jgi:hypothetical protein
MSNSVPPTEQALLAEYQACQEDINSSGNSYWTMAAIFLGISSAIMLGLMGGIIINNDLLQLLVKSTAETSVPAEIQMLRNIVVVIAIAVILVIACLRLWLKRVTFLQQINYERMRDIESQLGMWKSWRVHGVDHWKVETCDFDKEIKEIDDKTRLKNYKAKEWWCGWKNRRKYARSSRCWFDVIIAALMFMWVFIIFTILAPLLFPYSIIVSVLAGAFVVCLIRLTPI